MTSARSSRRRVRWAAPFGRMDASAFMPSLLAGRGSGWDRSTPIGRGSTRSWNPLMDGSTLRPFSLCSQKQLDNWSRYFVQGRTFRTGKAQNVSWRDPIDMGQVVSSEFSIYWGVRRRERDWGLDTGYWYWIRNPQVSQEYTPPCTLRAAHGW